MGARRTGVPLPETSTTCGLDDALSLIVTRPEVLPTFSGLNAMVKEHVVPGATEFPHPLWELKGLDVETELIESTPGPLLVSISSCVPLVPTACGGKLNGVVGEKRAAPVLSRVTIMDSLSERTMSACLSPLKSPTARPQSELPAL